MFDALAYPPAAVWARSMVSSRPWSRESHAGRPRPGVAPAATPRWSAPASCPNTDEVAETAKETLDSPPATPEGRAPTNPRTGSRIEPDSKEALVARAAPASTP
jgi:hypothetical protein